MSTRRVDDLIQALGCDGISSSQVSRICEQLDEVVESFLGRPLDGGPYPYVWLAFLRSLTARGLSGVELVTSDAHQGLKNAIAAVFTGASWQRCRTHFMANLLTRVPKRAQPGVATQDLLAWYAPSTSNCLPPRSTANWTESVEQLREPFAQVAELLADAAPDILACTAFPVAHWQKLWSNNPQERLNREIRRRRACPRKGTWWASSLTGYRRGAWWARCWPSNTTNGPKPAATSPSPTPSATRHCRTPNMLDAAA